MADKILSVFIDESGDFGAYDHHAPYYLVSMVLHDQRIDLSENFLGLDTHISNLGYPNHAIHTGPLIRRESVYEDDIMEQRKHLFHALFHFSRKLDFHYINVDIKKSECPDVIAMTAKLSRAMSAILQKHQAYFESFDQIIIYYDNGQIELTKILTSVFNTLFSHVEFRKVQPVSYKLFQVADLVCTMELLHLKAEAGSLSKSELEFFHSARDYKKNYWKSIEKKHL